MFASTYKVTTRGKALEAESMKPRVKVVSCPEWTPTQISQVRKMARDGKSTSQAAAVMEIGESVLARRCKKYGIKFDYHLMNRTLKPTRSGRARKGREQVEGG
jgi:hypothetical protein